MSDSRSPQEAYSRITGDIVIAHTIINNEHVATATWEGGDTIGISGDTIRELEDNGNFYGSKLGPAVTFYGSKLGSYVTMCNFKVRIFDYYESIDMYLAKRVE